MSLDIRTDRESEISFTRFQYDTEATLHGEKAKIKSVEVLHSESEAYYVDGLSSANTFTDFLYDNNESSLPYLLLRICYSNVEPDKSGGELSTFKDHADDIGITCVPPVNYRYTFLFNNVDWLRNIISENYAELFSANANCTLYYKSKWHLDGKEIFLKKLFEFDGFNRGFGEQSPLNNMFSFIESTFFSFDRHLIVNREYLLRKRFYVYQTNHVGEFSFPPFNLALDDCRVDEDIEVERLYNRLSTIHCLDSSERCLVAKRLLSVDESVAKLYRFYRYSIGDKLNLVKFDTTYHVEYILVYKKGYSIALQEIPGKWYSSCFFDVEISDKNNVNVNFNVCPDLINEDVFSAIVNFDLFDLTILIQVVPNPINEAPFAWEDIKVIHTL